jgi:uncharacterized protein YbaP (TraB family)
MPCRIQAALFYLSKTPAPAFPILKIELPPYLSQNLIMCHVKIAGKTVSLIFNFFSRLPDFPAKLIHYSKSSLFDKKKLYPDFSTREYLCNLLKIYSRMKKVSAGFLLSLWTLAGCAQAQDKIAPDNKTLLWKISGNGLTRPSYLFGTIHMLCATDAGLSDHMKKIIGNADEVYFEVDLDNLVEMFAVMSKMKMKGDTTLQDLLSKTDYEKVKDYFESKGSILPFSMLETYKPILALSTLQENSMACDATAMMEQVIMQEAKKSNKKIKGLETMAYQAGVLDSIPYKLQAEQLVSYINNVDKNTDEDKEMNEMMNAYKNQDLDKLEELMMKTDMGIGNFTDVLLVNRNRNWIAKLKDLLPEKSLLVAVGAGHLPGEKGVINLLRKAGYTVTPMENKAGKISEI